MCKNIIFNHICISYGLYFINDIICPTKRFFEYFTSNFKNIKIWIIKFKQQFDIEYLLLLKLINKLLII